VYGADITSNEALLRVRLLLNSFILFYFILWRRGVFAAILSRNLCFDDANIYMAGNSCKGNDLCKLSSYIYEGLMYSF